MAKEMTANELGYMATQYERFGNITKDEVIDAFIDESLDVDIDMLDDYNEYLISNGFEPYFGMEELDEQLVALSPLEIIQKTYFGSFNYSDEYCQFNGYENIDSFSEYQIIEEMKKDRDFLHWYIEENELSSDEEIEEAIKCGGKFVAMGY